MSNCTTTTLDKQQTKNVEKLQRYTIGELETMPLLYPNLAGIDVGSRGHFVSVPGDRCDKPVRTFGCTTPDLLEMAAWLLLCSITHVVLESTGVYWVPVARVLEGAGLTVALVDARESHRLSARKTDVYDCQWIRQLYACGLLRCAFRPAEKILPLRSYWRQRQELVSMCATSLHHMQKALELMNLQLHKVITDIAGLTGMRIIRSILEGQRDPETFAKPAADTSKPVGKRRKNQSHFDLAAEARRIAGVDLTRIEGIDALTAFTIITEQGVDMSAFPTEKHFSSHLGLCPNNRITGGRVRKRSTRHVNSRAADALRIAAQSLTRSKTALGAFCRRIRARHGAPVAIVATANKMSKIIYRMLKFGEEYVAQGQEKYEQDYRERLINNLKRQAKAVGCQVLVPETGEVIS